MPRVARADDVGAELMPELLSSSGESIGDTKPEGAAVEAASHAVQGGDSTVTGIER